MYNKQAFGIGVWKSLDGCFTYKGYFLRDKRHGYGNQIIIDERYEGEFSQNQFCGNFTRHSSDGRAYNQVWTNDNDRVESIEIHSPEDIWFNKPYVDDDGEKMRAENKFEAILCGYCNAPELERMKHRRCSQCK